MSASPVASMAADEGRGIRSAVWLFSPTIDLLTFGGSAALPLVLLGLGAATGKLSEPSPEWTWVTLVLAIDVAHVWGTAWRAYIEPREWRRRAAVLIGVPLVVAILGGALHAESEAGFWRVLAYLAVWHFVRQQYGWVTWYRRKANEPEGWERVIYVAAIYAATLYPLIDWHAHPPEHFAWFVAGDFGSLPAWCASVAWPIYLLALIAYGTKAFVLLWRGRPQPGKDLVVVTTALCWYLGIVAFDSDYAFTVTNIPIHGIPYLVLIVAYRRGWLTGARGSEADPGVVSEPVRTRSTLRVVWQVLITVWAAAYLEELLWDRFVWQERSWLFGAGVADDLLRGWWAPLLAVPQVTHYLLDGILWRRKDLVDAE